MEHSMGFIVGRLATAKSMQIVGIFVLSLLLFPHSANCEELRQFQLPSEKRGYQQQMPMQQAPLNLEEQRRYERFRRDTQNLSPEKKATLIESIRTQRNAAQRARNFSAVNYYNNLLLILEAE